VSDSKPPGASQTNTPYALAGLGASLLTIGAYLGFLRHGDQRVVFTLLACGVGCFAGTLWQLRRRRATGVAVARPTAPETSDKLEATPHVGNIPPDVAVKAEIKIERTGEGGDQSKPQVDPVFVAMPANSALSDLLLAALLVDPASARRTFELAVVKARGFTKTGAAPATTGESDS